MQTTNYQTTHNLDLLRILYIVKACFNFLGALFFAGYAVFGSLFFNMMGDVPSANHSEPFPSPLSWIFILIGAIGMIICLVYGILTLLAAKRIKERRSYTFILVVGILNCFTGMLGIALGVFSIVELNKPDVKALFQRNTESSTEF
jgi:hypothetical protein